MNDYEINLDDEWNDETVLWHFDEELVNETVDDDCKIWGFFAFISIGTDTSSANSLS